MNIYKTMYPAKMNGLEPISGIPQIFIDAGQEDLWIEFVEFDRTSEAVESGLPPIVTKSNFELIPISSQEQILNELVDGNQNVISFFIDELNNLKDEDENTGDIEELEQEVQEVSAEASSSKLVKLTVAAGVGYGGYVLFKKLKDL